MITISPYGNDNGLHCALELNHRSQPNYRAGGIQLQTWDGESLLDYRNSRSNGTLATSREVIHVTVVLSIEKGALRVEVINGTSSTWGNFGGKGELKSWVPSRIGHLNNYDSTLSIERSKVGYAAHRVRSLTRIAVRKYSAYGLVDQIHTADVVHPVNTGP